MPSTALQRAFPHRHVILPVIHVTSSSQALRNTTIAMEYGADGVFLINHSTADDELLAIHADVCRAFPGFWVGLNCLGLKPKDVFARLSENVMGVWVDNALVDERQVEQPDAESVLHARRTSGWNGLYFGGVAFKYQRSVGDVTLAARIAGRYMDVVTTSGSGTGHAADVDKIRTMKAALGGFPLAVASGITPGNIHEYLPYVDCYLVATGINRSFEELDPVLLARLVGVVRAHDHESRELARCKGIVVIKSPSKGLVFEIDLAAFPESEPTFAYWDDNGRLDDPMAASLLNLSEAGWLDVDHKGIHHCQLFKGRRPSGGSAIASLKTLMPGEIDVKIFHVKPDNSAELLWYDNFNIK